MSDIVERLREYASDDHERGCQGRYYDCDCGYDSKRDPLLEEAAARIEQLEAALRLAQRGLDPYATYETQLEARVVVDGICAALVRRHNNIKVRQEFVDE